MCCRVVVLGIWLLTGFRLRRLRRRVRSCDWWAGYWVGLVIGGVGIDLMYTMG